MVFKTKNITSKKEKNKGARCDQSGKAAVIDVLNKIFDDRQRYSKQTLSRENNAIQLCSEQEMYLRYFDKTRKDGKRWFLTSAEQLLSNI